MAWQEPVPVEQQEALDESDAAEGTLARRLGEREPAAFEMVIRRHNRRLYRVARSILRDDAEAEDAVQEAYVKALGNIASFRGHASLSTWLTRILINEALGRLRSRREKADLAEIEGAGADGPDGVSPQLRRLLDDGPERAAARGQLRALLERKIEELPNGFRPVFVLRAVEGLSVEETAAHLGIPEATVKTRFHRARMMLREALDELVGETLKESFPFAGERCDRMTTGVLGRLGLKAG